MNPSELALALTFQHASHRLRAVLIAGSEPNSEFIPLLIAACENESDFFVRDMLTWALIQHESTSVIAALAPELNSPIPQARAQALHTISKLNNPELWHLITDRHLLDDDDVVAPTAWRAAARMVPRGSEQNLADLLATQFGRGDKSVQASLSKALVQLTPHSRRAIELGKANAKISIRTHALATQRLLNKPEYGYELALEYAITHLAQLHWSGSGADDS